MASADGGRQSESAADAAQREARNLAHLAGVEVDCVVELARRKMKLSEARSLTAGSVVSMEKLAGERFEVLLNDRSFAFADIVVYGERVTARIARMAETPGGPDQLVRELRERQAQEQLPSPPPVAETDPAETDLRAQMTFIPGGSFIMGGRAADTPENQRPARVVQLSSFYIARFPVTNQDYSEFVKATGHKGPIHWQRGVSPDQLAKHPVVNVSWHDAKTYAEWSGARLPSEAEWEKAARGTDERLYPWGSRFVDGERCNSNNMVGTTLPVDEFPLGRSPYGVWDMVGNVNEWCQDFYDEDYYKYGPPTDPGGPEGGRDRVVRGGFFRDARHNVRTTHRDSVPDTHTRDSVGFRLALDATGAQR